MKHRLLNTLGLIVLALVAFAASPANAQTTSNGPYYATPSWDQKLQCDTQATCPRFILLANWNNEAVLDRETGLVWEKSPSTTTFTWSPNLVTPTAGQHCAKLSVGNRKGWKLPTIQELASLVDGDPANTSSPRLPPGHPFQNVQNSYWSATSEPSTVSAWAVAFSSGTPFGIAKTVDLAVWCVRGGQGVDPQ